MAKGNLTSARVRIGFTYQDAKNSGIRDYGAPSDSQIIAKHQAGQKAKEKLDRDLERLRQLPGLRERAAALLQSGLSIRETVRQLKRDERQQRLVGAQNSK
jgi:hypothetical protein